MRNHVTRLGIVASTLALLIAGSSTVLALPPQASAHAQTATKTMTMPMPATNSTGSSNSMTGKANGQAHLAAAKLKVCQNRENAIKNIISRINTRVQNQLTLFGTIATRVENFYTSKGKTVPTYVQLVSDVAAAKTQAQTDMANMQSHSSFSCSSSDPKGMVSSFQGYMKTEITDLQNYRTAVKNLIVAVAKANGATVSTSSQSTTTGGQQ